MKYPMRMKRTNLVLDEHLLEEAVRRAHANRILELAGSGLWEGNLPEIRGDQRRRPHAQA